MTKKFKANYLKRVCNLCGQDCFEILNKYSETVTTTSGLFEFKVKKGGNPSHPCV